MRRRGRRELGFRFGVYGATSTWRDRHHETSPRCARADPRFTALAPKIRAFARGQAQALQAHAWNGAWLNRAWIPLPNRTASDEFPGGWACTNGADRRLCLEPQPWAMLASQVPVGQTP